MNMLSEHLQTIRVGEIYTNIGIDCAQPKPASTKAWFTVETTTISDGRAACYRLR